MTLTSLHLALTLLFFTVVCLHFATSQSTWHQKFLIFATGSLAIVLSLAAQLTGQMVSVRNEVFTFLALPLTTLNFFNVLLYGLLRCVGRENIFVPLIHTQVTMDYVMTLVTVLVLLYMVTYLEKTLVTFCWQLPVGVFSCLFIGVALDRVICKSEEQGEDNIHFLACLFIQTMFINMIFVALAYLASQFADNQQSTEEDDLKKNGLQTIKVEDI